jgi:glycosyltransferase involved in cell wall biosynthesis
MKVSVMMITYNHERYIAKAIESVLMQQTDFDYELIIGEDCSTDGTRTIVRTYGKRYPERIRLLLPEYNLGAQSNLAATLNACRGEYIASLEGDDYWINPNKLQKQVDFLEKNNSFSLCGHWVDNVDANGNLWEKQIFTGQYCPEVFGVVNALEGTPIHTSSLMYRTSALQQILLEEGDLLKKYFWDDPLLLLLLTKGDGYCLQEFMGAYRIYPGGTWSSQAILEKNSKMLLFYYALPQLLGGKYKKEVTQQIRKGENEFARSLLEVSIHTKQEFLRQYLRNESITKKRIVKLLIKSLHCAMMKPVNLLVSKIRRILHNLKYLLISKMKAGVDVKH